MTEIVITEFMDDTAVANQKARFSVHYDPELYANPDEMARLFADVPAVIVRNQHGIRTELVSLPVDGSEPIILFGGDKLFNFQDVSMTGETVLVAQDYHEINGLYTADVSDATGPVAFKKVAEPPMPLSILSG